MKIYMMVNINDGEDDDRLTYTLITLDLGDLINIFEENNISLVDMLLLSKDDLKELQLKLENIIFQYYSVGMTKIIP